MITNVSRLLISALSLLVVANVAQAQAKSAATTVAKSPSPELVGLLTKQLSITPQQATGGVGTIFGLAKSHLSSTDFSKIAAVVPGMSGFLKAAPSVSPPSSGGIPGMSSISASLPGASGGLGAATGAFQKLGLSPDMVSRFLPIVTQFLQAKGGPGVASLLSKGLK